MKNILLKSLSLILCLTMLFGTVCISASAEKKQISNTSDNVDLTFEGNSGFDLILNNLEETNVNEFDNGCSITNVKMKEKTATVLCTTDRNSKVVVAVYDDITGQMLGSGIADITAETEKVEVEININQMPKYYLVKAYILDSKMAPLTSSFSFFEKTSVYEQFMSVSPDDYDPERVVQLGDDVYESFAALSTDVEIPDYNSQMSVEYDSDMGTYTFKNATSEIKELKVGDLLYYELEDDDFVLLKVKSIQINGSTVIITEDEEISLDEAFDYVRYDEGLNADDFSEEDIITGECVSLAGDVEVQSAEEVNLHENPYAEVGVELQSEDDNVNEDAGYEGSDVKGQLLSPSFEIAYPSKKAALRITGKIGFIVGASAKLHWDINIGPDYFEFKVEVETKLNFELKATGGIELDNEKVFWQLDGLDEKGNPKGIKIGKGLIKLYIKVYPIASFQGEFDTLNVSLLSLKGVSINSNDGYNKISDGSKWIDASESFDFKIIIKLGAGISFEVGRKCGKQDEHGDQKLIATVEVTFDIYLEGTFDPEIFEPLKIDKEAHPCNFCADIEASFNVEGSLNVNLKLFKILSKIKNESIKKHIKNNGKFVITALSVSWNKPLWKGYLSNNDDHGWELAEGTCPNKRVKVTVNVKKTLDDGTVVPAENAQVFCDGKFYQTDSTGVALLYLKKGNKTVTVTVDSFSESKTVSIGEFEKTLDFLFANTSTLTVYAKGKLPNGSIVPLKDASVSCGGKYYKTDSYGKVAILLKEGNYNLIVMYNTEYKSQIVMVGKDDLTIEIVFDKLDLPDNVSWSYNNGTITISGTGNMSGYSFGKMPWNAYKDTTNSVVVEEGVTGIGAYAFAQFTHIDSVSLPSTLTKIGEAAFYECNSLTSLQLPESVKSVGNYAFYSCYLMNTLDLGAVETIGMYAFANCRDLKTVEIPAETKSVGDSAFAWCNALKKITFYNASSTIYDSANTVNSSATIYSGSKSTAKSYASKYGRPFVSISNVVNNSEDDFTLVINSESDNYGFAEVTLNSAEANSGVSKYAVEYASCIPGEDYILVNVTGWGNGFVLNSNNLFYIDQVTADSNGVVSIEFIPKQYHSNSTTLLIGEFSNGVEQKQVAAKVVRDITIEEIGIKTPSVNQVKYGDTLILHADFGDEELPEGYAVEWSFIGVGAKLTPYEKGLTCGVTCVDSGEVVVTATLVDADGEPVCDSDGEEIEAQQKLTMKGGFFWKIISFFKDLFRISRVILMGE